MPPSDRRRDISGSSQRPLAGIDRKRHRAAGERADAVLPFGADVPDAGAKADRQADRDQHQRRRLDHQLRQAAQVVSGSMKMSDIAATGSLPSTANSTKPAEHRQHHRQERRQLEHRPRRLLARLEPQHDAAVPLSQPQSAVSDPQVRSRWHHARPVPVAASPAVNPRCLTRRRPLPP